MRPTISINTHRTRKTRRTRLAGIFALTGLLVGLGFLTSCYKRAWFGQVTISFTFSYNGETLETLNSEHLFVMPKDTETAQGTATYADETTDEPENPEDPTVSQDRITIEEIRYFISKVYLIEEDGSHVALGTADGSGCHFVDFALAGTRQWTIEDVPAGHYVGFGFIYGLDEADNISRRFSNPPESLMFWPDALGGGYHYMQINGKWMASGQSERQPYGLHTGIGQTWAEGAVTAFHHNYVRLEFPDAFSRFLTMDGHIGLTVDMDVMQWLTNPNDWNFAVQGGAIMQNQAAQQILKENAWNVFSIH